MTAFMIRRTYNKHGDHDFLTEFDAGVPVWCADKRKAICTTEPLAVELVEHIGRYRDALCPDGIEGVEIVATNRALTWSGAYPA